MRFRHLHGEMMEREDLPAACLQSAFRGLTRLHSLSNAANGVAKRIIALLPIDYKGPVALIELGCGDGSFLRSVTKRIESRGLDVQSLGIDLNFNAVQLASLAELPNYNYACVDACEIEYHKDFDVGFTSLFLHHLGAAQSLTMLRKLTLACRFGFVCFDLHRSRLAWLATWLACRAVTRSPVVRNDGPRSVEAAYKHSEIRQLVEQLDQVSFRILPAFPLGYYLIVRPLA